MGVSVPPERIAVDGSLIAHVAAAVGVAVAVELFVPQALARHANAVVLANDRRKVEHKDERAVPVEAAVGEDAVLAVVVRDPFEAVYLVVPEGRRVLVEVVEVAEPLHQALVQRLVGEVPFQRPVVVPLAVLSELAAHKEQLLAGVAEHVGVEQPQVGCLLPVVARHFAPQGVFAVHHLVVGEGERVVFGERPAEGPGQVAVVVLAVDRLLARVLERVVHPAHVPLVEEAEAAVLGGGGDAGPGGRLLGQHDRLGVLVVDVLVGVLEEADGAQVFAAAVHVGRPVALPRVVAVEHGSDRVDPEAVHVVLVHPEEGIGEEKIAHAVLAEVEDARAPVRMLPHERVLVFEEVRAVKVGEPLRVRGEVAGHPVHDNTDPALMQRVDEVH